MFAWQSYVFVHVEGDHVLKGYFAGLEGGDETLIDAKGRRARRKSQDKLSCFLMGVDCGYNVVGSPFAHQVVVLLDD